MLPERQDRDREREGERRAAGRRRSEQAATAARPSGQWAGKKERVDVVQPARRAAGTAGATRATAWRHARQRQALARGRVLGARTARCGAPQADGELGRGRAAWPGRVESAASTSWMSGFGRSGRARRERRRPAADALGDLEERPGAERVPPGERLPEQDAGRPDVGLGARPACRRGAPGRCTRASRARRRPRSASPPRSRARGRSRGSGRRCRRRPRAGCSPASRRGGRSRARARGRARRAPAPPPRSPRRRRARRARARGGACGPGRTRRRCRRDPRRGRARRRAGRRGAGAAWPPSPRARRAGRRCPRGQRSSARPRGPCRSSNACQTEPMPPLPSGSQWAVPAEHEARREQREPRPPPSPDSVSRGRPNSFCASEEWATVARIPLQTAL